MPTKIEADPSDASPSKRRFFLRDALVFLVLTCITLVLYALTLLLFRSFEGRRATLAIYWSDRGKEELSHGHADQASISLRNAVSFAPYDRHYELLLAESLAESGHTDQAMNYFLGLWDTQPGDGFTNLELARLSRTKGLMQQAVDYYHAAIFGDWQGEGSVHRRAVRLELADYLTSVHDMAAARAELLIASGNASNSADINLVLGGKFAAIDDAPDALNSYKKALEGNPREQAALEAAGRLSLQLGDYEAAHAFFDKEIQVGIQDGKLIGQVFSLSAEARQLQELNFSAHVPDHERAEHLLEGKAIAEARFNTCSAQLGNPSKEKATLPALKPRWVSEENVSLRALEDDQKLQERISALIIDTEILASKACGVPSGDDAILLRLSRPGMSTP